MAHLFKRIESNSLFNGLLQLVIAYELSLNVPAQGAAFYLGR